jgi:hypothetical protein
VGSAAATAGVTVLSAVLGHSAHADTGLVARYPAGATTTWFSGQAFDACDAPPRSVMQAWRSSPFGALGLYISGGHRACSQRELNATWVRDVSAMGWRFLPLDVSLQAPCADNRRLHRMSSNPGTASSQGSDAAAGALREAGSLGILPGSPIYSDIEGYNGNDARCGEAVRAYLSGWTGTLHAAGYLGGVYGNLSSGMRGLSDAYLDATYTRPDVVWNAQWDNKANLTGWRGVSDDHWPEHQRVKQFRGDHNESYGGFRVNIDSNAVDAPVATTAQPLQVLTGEAGDTGSIIDALPAVTESAVCRVGQGLDAWNMLVDGSYVPDAGLAPGAVTSSLPACARPYQVLSLGELRRQPGDAADSAGAVHQGSLAWVRCELPGTTAGLPVYWHRLERGAWISGALLARPDAAAGSPGLPLCDTTSETPAITPGGVTPGGVTPGAAADPAPTAAPAL